MVNDKELAAIIALEAQLKRYEELLRSSSIA
jgi:hypothetical protein